MDYRVISADDHIDLRWMPQDLWTERLPVHLRERGPRVQETERGPHWFCDGQMWGAWGTYSGAQGSGVKWAIEMGGALREGELRPTIAEMRLADMDRDGVDASVMYGPTDPFVIADDELRRAVYQVYNDWLLDFQSADPARLLGVAQLPMDDPSAARDEMERLAKKGMRRFNVLAARADPPVYDDRWDPFWALAQELDVPIAFHLAVDVRRGTANATQPANPVVAGAVRTTMNMQGFQLVDPFAGLIFNGTLDRFPKVRLIMAEAGLAWVPHMIQSFDYFAKRLREGRVSIGDAELRMPAMQPSAYFPRSIYVTFQDDGAGMQMVGARHPDGLVLLEPDRVMWASDYPHPASTWPDSQRVIEKTMRGVDPDVRQKVLVGNAIRLYELA
jgi:predicted TIM-barrel fold metal-dependent hydrolase